MHFRTQSIGKMILIVLAEEPSLNAKQIYVRIIRQSGRAISYQAVHKKVIGMVNEGIVAKNNHFFTINPAWLNEVGQLVETARQNTAIAVKENITDLSPIQQIRAHFDNKYKDEEMTKEPFY